MSDERFERDLRTALRSLAPNEADERLRERVVAIPHEEPQKRTAVMMWRGIAGLAVAACAATLVLLIVPGHPTQGPTASHLAGTLRSVELTTYDGDTWAFDFPAGWRFYPYQFTSSMSDIAGFLATIKLDTAKFCQQTVTGNGTETRCNFAQYRLTPGSLVVTIAGGGGIAFGSGPFENKTPAGTTRVKVGGMPAFYRTSVLPNSARRLSWTIARPDALDNYVSLQVDLLAPVGGQLESQVRAMVASVRFRPPVVPLPTDSASKDAAAASAVAALKALKPEGAAYACFPAVPGTSQSAVIRQVPFFGGTLRKPLPVECSMTIEPSDLQFWKMTLTISWDAGSDRKSGRYIIVQWVTREGGLSASVGGGSGSSEPPYF